MEREYTESEVLAMLTDNGVEHLDRISSVTRPNSADCGNVVMEEPCVPNADCGEVIMETLGTPNAYCGDIVIEILGAPNADSGEVVAEECRTPTADYWEAFIKECCVAIIENKCSKLCWISTNREHLNVLTLFGQHLPTPFFRFVLDTGKPTCDMAETQEAEWKKKNRERSPQKKPLIALDLLAGLLGHLGQ
ncbi:hypothetical protein GP486_008692 [Trichoglossum hirsutum]|uniref:Uncharacterized protein n=1 Tax=Trichoglossum hirsutum TaxID=265104 RepID=A0A9P8L087_9PEZI|nr:hypothetical protein GP486_008692 [Trichoglossum hirsutum]